MFGRRKQYGDSLVVAFALITVGGCANLRLPAIDPSGRGIFLPAPNYTTLDASGVNPATGRPNCPLLRRFTSGGLFNSQAGTPSPPPDYADGPVFSSPPDVPDCETPLSAVPYTTAALDPQLANPAPMVAPVSPRVLVPGAYEDPLTAAENVNQGCFGQSRTPSNPQAGISLAPRQQVAMVGTEVLMVAGVCGGDGYYRMREPIEWTLAQGSVGQFVEPGQAVVGRFGLRGALTSFLAEPVPELLSNNYAVACTSKRTQVLTRGTIPIDDDVIVQKGQGWIGVSSPIEGSTYVTVTAPDLDGWEQRTQTAVIHWVDGEWRLPDSAIISDNQPHVLTTTVARKASGLPASGYLVRYQILDPTATFDDGTTSREVATDAMGQASARIVPATPAGGTARVQVDVIRPARGQVLEPLTIGQGIATVTWTSSELGVQVRGPESVNVGDTPTYQLEVRNPGNTTASGVQLTALVPAGFEPIGTSPQANALGNRLEWIIGDLGASESRTVSVTYRAVESGTVRHCATAQGTGVAAVENCLTTNVAEPDALYIEMIGPNPELTLPVGEEIVYRVTVTNRGTRPLRDVLLLDRFDNGFQHVSGGSPIDWDIGDLAPGQSREIGLRFQISAPGRHCHTLEASAPNTPTATTGACVTAEERASGPPPQSQGSLRLEKTGPTEMIEGQLGNFYLIVENDGDVPLTNLTITDAYDREFEPVNADPADAERTADGFRWYVSRLEPNDRQTFEVRCKAVYDGRRACSQAYAQAADGFRRSSNEICLPVLPDSGATRSSTPGLERDPEPDAFGTPPRDATPLPGADGRPRGASPLPDGGFGANSRLNNSVEPQPAPSAGSDGFDQAEEGGLQVSIDSRTDRKRVGESVEYLVTVVNARDVADSDVVITLQLPRQAKLEWYTGPVQAQDWSADWRRITMPAIQTMRPGDTVEFLVRVRVEAAGELRARVVAESVRTRQGVAREDVFLADV